VRIPLDHRHLEPSRIAKTFIVIAAYNEARVLGSTLEGLIPSPYEIVVVDDGSRDDTREVVKAYPVRYLRHPINMGQGAALQTGTDYALSCGADFIVHFDADGQHPADRIGALLQPVTSGNCDVAVGSRFLDPSNTELVPPARRWVLRCGAVVSGILTGVWLSDTHNGFRAMSRLAATKIRFRENGSAHATEFLDEAKHAKLRIQEVPVAIRYTDYSKQKGQRSSESVNILLDLLLRKLL
jgi:glycosyltransferase involved in cell wall biosynthesis